ncbi:hypothetical protein [Photobacterium sp. DNB22_13_2]
MSKTMRLSWLNCAKCDSNKIEVTTEQGNDEWIYDGDKLTCLDCGATGELETDGGITWFEADKEPKNAQFH